MATETINQEYNEANNTAYTNANILSVRLNTEPILQRIEKHLGVRKKYFEDEYGNVKEVIELGVNPRCNLKGADQILSFVANIVNPQVVQGNFDENEYRYYIANVRQDLAEEIFIHADDWEIADQDQEYITDSVMNLIKPFMSRLKYNKERDSYSNTLRHVESNTQQQSGFRLFGKR
jgi:hypothetical protein